MIKHTIETHLYISSYDELSSENKSLIDHSKQQVQNSYSPYSEFKVGAAVALENGKIFAASNQENAAYPSGICAERNAIFFANAQYPDVAVKTIAIAAYTNGDFIEKPITPCGACRQVLLETETRYATDITILLYGKSEVYIITNAKSLLPLCFTSESLEHKT